MTRTAVAQDGGAETTHPCARPPRGDRGDIIAGWLIKLTVSLAVGGLVLFDGLSVLTTAVSLADHAAGAAREGVRAAETSPDVRAVQNAVVDYAHERNPDNVVNPAGIVVQADGTTTVTLQRTATTLVLSRLGPLADWTHRTATDTASPVR